MLQGKFVLLCPTYGCPILWIRRRMVKALSLRSKDPVFDPAMRSSVVKIANHS